jgi:hypothetical protein
MLVDSIVQLINGLVGPTTPILCKTMLSICKSSPQFEGVLDTDKKSLLYLQQHPEKTTYVHIKLPTIILQPHLQNKSKYNITNLLA